jgi:hypothetical protein
MSAAWVVVVAIIALFIAALFVVVLFFSVVMDYLTRGRSRTWSPARSMAGGRSRTLSLEKYLEKVVRRERERKEEGRGWRGGRRGERERGWEKRANEKEGRGSMVVYWLVSK